MKTAGWFCRVIFAEKKNPTKNTPNNIHLITELLFSHYNNYIKIIRTIYNVQYGIVKFNYTEQVNSCGVRVV